MFFDLQIIHLRICFNGAQLFWQRDPSLPLQLKHEHYNKVVLPTVMSRIKSSIPVFKKRNELLDCLIVKWEISLFEKGNKAFKITKTVSNSTGNNDNNAFYSWGTFTGCSRWLYKRRLNPGCAETSNRDTSSSLCSRAMEEFFIWNPPVQKWVFSLM